MKRVFIVILSVFVAINVMGQAQNKRYLDYISKYKHLAIKEQYLYGIPASIKMAQALIESNAGQSMLAVKGRNHFGIKCTSQGTETLTFTCFETPTSNIVIDILIF